MKSQHRAKLQQDLVKYSKQIGILDNEIPRLILDRKEMRSLVQGKIQDDNRIAGCGQCFYPIRTIFVDGSRRIYKDYVRCKGKKLYESHLNGYWRPVIASRKIRYNDILHTLVHELVHYRFAYLSHGPRFEQRIKEILQDRTFEPKHVHLFSHITAKYRKNIE
jgi:hypothetical protein